MSNSIEKVSIKFKAGAYGAYRSMNNKVWYALAEFIDNALQSYISRKEEIRIVEGTSFQFKVFLDINLDEDYIKISDNAGGIDFANFIRAFEPANIPIDNTGLSEFGMGMKIASIWLADFYSVRTSALGERVEREIAFDLQKVIEEEKEELKVKNSTADPNSHFTEILMKGLSENAPKRRGISSNRIKDHLTSIYRKFLRSGEMELLFNGEPLSFEEPEILYAPFVNTPDGEEIHWKKEIDFEFENFKVKGFIGLLKKMQAKHCGISLFRRGRVIQGSHDEKYHPTIICGQSGSPRDKRLFGELELEGFKVSFDKGRFTQVDEIDMILGLVKKELNSPSFNLLKQGDKYIKPKTDSDKSAIINKTLKSQKQKTFDLDYKSKRNKALNEIKIQPSIHPIPVQVQEKNRIEKITEVFPWNGKDYSIEISFIKEKGLELLRLNKIEGKLYDYNGSINLSHPFFENHKIISSSSLEPFIVLFKGLLLSEVISAAQGTKNGGYLRANLSKILKNI